MRQVICLVLCVCVCDRGGSSSYRASGEEDNGGSSSWALSGGERYGGNVMDEALMWLWRVLQVWYPGFVYFLRSDVCYFIGVS